MNNLQHRFTENEIPYHQFERLGYSKWEVLNFDKDSLKALLSGKRTHIFPIKGVDDNNLNFELRAKFSLIRNSDNTVSLSLHPVREMIKNDIGLNEKQIRKLEAGNLITKTINNERYLVQLDLDTKEILKAKTKSIIIPAYIKGVKTSPKDMEKLRKGGNITIKSVDGEQNVSIDLNSLYGFKFSSLEFDKKLKEEYDRNNPHIVGYLQTDENNFQFSKAIEQADKKNKMNI